MQRELKKYGDQLPHFVEFLKAQGVEFLKRLNIPVSKDSVLLDPTKLSMSALDGTGQVHSPRPSREGYSELPAATTRLEPDRRL